MTHRSRCWESLIAATFLASATIGACYSCHAQSVARPAAPNAKPAKSSAQGKPAPKMPGAQKPPAPAPQKDAPAPRPSAPASKTGLPPLPPVDVSVPPPSLPRASRERMRACAEEWDKIKKSATAAEPPMWRNFATGCLTRKTDP